MTVTWLGFETRRRWRSLVVLAMRVALTAGPCSPRSRARGADTARSTSAVRRRRHELAGLRALGLTGRQARLAVVTQATLLAVLGLAAGIPLGLALGRACGARSRTSPLSPTSRHSLRGPWR